MAILNFVDGKEVEWADIRLYIAGVETLKFTAINFGTETENEHLHAGGDDPISIQSGNRKPTGSLTLLKGDYDIMDAAAVAAGGRDVNDLEFDVLAYYKPKGIRPPVRELLQGCRISNHKNGMTQGAKKMEVELPFLFLKRKKLP